jgi:hypothetical protein
MPDPKTHSITIRVSTKMLRQIDRRRGAASRERFIIDTVQACFAKLDAPKRSRVTNAIAASTDLLKTGRYEP